MSTLDANSPGSRKERLLGFLDRWQLSLILGVCLAIQGFILTATVPAFGEMFREMGMDRLPEATAALLSLSRWVCGLWFVYWPAAALLSVLAVRVPPGAKRYLAPATVLVMGACVALQVYVLFLPQPVGTFRMEPPK